MTEPVPTPKSRIEIYTHEPMVNWLDFGQLLDAGIRAVVAGTFGTFADSRLIQAALNPPAGNPPLPADNKDTIWIDYVADTGDGWDSTYSVAWSISRESLSVPGIDRPLPRGDLLVFGGDQVYPTPAGNGYRTRFLDPYSSAFPAAIPSPTDMSTAPKLIAIPGNHDWYDGLAGFGQTFCSRKPIGGWQTVQHTSYFAVKLPHGWWLWGLDLQLESQIDQPQYDYFKSIAKDHLQAGDRVVLVTPEPSWIDESERLKRDGADADQELHAKRTEAKYRLRDIETQTPRFRSLRVIEQLVADSNKATVAAVLTGDQHLYAHYQPVARDGDGAPHRITCGGGGAYLLGTHDLPATLRFRSGGGEQQYTRAVTFPGAATSRKLRNQMWMLPIKNPVFSALLAMVYLLYVWLLQSASKVPNAALNGTSLMEYLAQVPLTLKHAFTTLPEAVLAVLTHSPATVVLTLIIVGGSAAFTAAGVKGSKFVPGIGGALHGLLHLSLALLLLWCMARVNLHSLQLSVDELRQILLFIVETALVGGVLGGMLYGVWIIITNMLFRWHGEDAFSAQSIPDYKSFLRLRIDNTGLTLYPLKIETVCRRWNVGNGIEPLVRSGRIWLLRAYETWQLRAFSGNGARFVPRTPIKVELIEPPLLIPATSKVQA
jgi:hypothetical protein